MASSPLGKYSQVVAAIVATLTIMAAVVLHGLGRGDGFVDNLALIAIGAVFGAGASTAITNGTVKRDLDALHKRLDTANLPASSASPQG